MAATAGQKSGLGFYVENLVQAMRALPKTPELVEIRTVRKNLRTPARIAWDQLGLPLVALTKRLDLLFVPAFSAPRFPKPLVMTAHDIFGVLHPDHFTGPARRYWTHLLPQSMRRADHLVCVSESTRDAIVTHLGIPAERMTVVPLAAGSEFTIQTDTEAIERHLAEMGVEAPFVLSVGTLEPRKNFERLLDAFAFADRGDAKLVLVGKKGWDYAGIFDKIRKYHLQNTVVYLDYVSQEQLVALYNACLFFVMPSLYEGFGLPALEAMQCGAPVAVSQNSSLPEVVGEAGVVFDPYDVDSIRARLNLLLGSPERRSDMQKKSMARAGEFSWQRTAEQTVGVFEQVLRARK
jgi:glycosyltransferase involved in cell wall biosynthesis